MRQVALMRQVILAFAVGLCFSLSAQARVFDTTNESFAAYLKGEYGPSSIKQTGFASASNDGETYSGSLTSIYGGEFGFIYATKFVALRFGIEVLRPPTLKANASNSSGALYSVSEDITAVIPKVGFEFRLKSWKNSKLYLNANYGQAQVEMLNAYNFTAAGTSLTGLNNYTEDAKGIANDMDGSLGFETLLSDQTTIALELGYRSLKFTSMTQNRAADTIPQGNVTTGMPVLNADGSKRTLDFSGPTATLMFRIWIN